MSIALFWTLLSVAGLARQFHTLREAFADKQALGDAGNGRRVIANEQIEAALEHGLIQLLYLSAGVIALRVPLPVEENPEISVRAVVLPLLLMAAQVVTIVRHERAASARRRWMAVAHIPARRAEDMQASLDDTNAKVTRQGAQIDEMQEQGRTDRPAEETDREEGREHRGKG